MNKISKFKQNFRTNHKILSFLLRIGKVIVLSILSFTIYDWIQLGRYLERKKQKNGVLISTKKLLSVKKPKTSKQISRL